MIRIFLSCVFFFHFFFARAEVNIDSVYAMRYTKSMQDSVFVIGDLIRGPEVIFPLAYEQVIDQSLRQSIVPYVHFFQKNPFLICELHVHTDTRGNSEENQELSLRRARHLIELMPDSGYFLKERIVPVGKGEAQPLFSEEFINRYKTQTAQFEKLHQANSRIEIRIKGFLGKNFYLNNNGASPQVDPQQIRNSAYYEDLILIADRALLEGNYLKALEYYSYAADVAPANETYALEQRDKIKVLLNPN